MSDFYTHTAEGCDYGRRTRIVALVATVLALAACAGAVVALALGGAPPGAPPEPAASWGVPGGLAMEVAATATAYPGMSCNVFTEPGCSKFVVASGGAIEVLAGGSLTSESGATVSLTGLTTTGGQITGDTEVTGTLTANAGSITTTLTAADLTASDDLSVGDDATVSGDLVANSATVTGTVSAADLTASDDLSVGDDADVDGDLTAGSVTVTGTLQYGGVYPVGFALDGYQLVLGSDTITATQAITHGLTTPLYAFCTMAGTLTDNEEQHCSAGIVTDTVTIYVYKEDGSAGDSGVAVYWGVYGTP